MSKRVEATIIQWFAAARNCVPFKFYTRFLSHPPHAFPPFHRLKILSRTLSPRLSSFNTFALTFTQANDEDQGAQSGEAPQVSLGCVKLGGRGLNLARLPIKCYRIGLWLLAFTGSCSLTRV
jgi:hypothetical protein